jgi:putative ABC transport system substrate-binding protein
LIFADTTSPGIAARNATRTIPIVVASGGDMVAMGLVASLARPGGNVTGLDQISPELGGKRLELLKEMVPKVASVAVLWNSRHQASTLNWKELQAPARKLGLQLRSLDFGDAGELDRAFAEAAKARVDAIAIMPDPLYVTHLKRLAELAAKFSLPSLFHLSEFAEAGGLMSYGPDRTDLFRRAATHVDKILKGAKPADLPVEQPTKFELVVNMKTAQALGIAPPATIMVRADRIIR